MDDAIQDVIDCFDDGNVRGDNFRTKLLRLDWTQTKDALKRHMLKCKDAQCVTCKRVRLLTFAYRHPLHYVLLVESGELSWSMLQIKKTPVELIRNGIDVHQPVELFSMDRSARRASAIELAREILCRRECKECSAAWAVCKSVEPWSIHTHHILPMNRRNSAMRALLLGYAIAFSQYVAGQESAWVDIWRLNIMPYLVAIDASY